MIRGARSRPLAPLGLGIALLACSSGLLADHLQAQDEPPIAVHLTVASTVARVGDTGEIIAEVACASSAAGPLLLTPTSDGPAIEVVRGRLLRADAEDPRAIPLRFHVPWIATTPGDAVVRVRVDGWSCIAPRDGTEPRCRAVRSEAAMTLTVRP